MKTEPMTYESYLKNLHLLDWMYMMSDDNYHYNRGAEQVASYKRLAESKDDPKWLAAFNAEAAKAHARR